METLSISTETTPSVVIRPLRGSVPQRQIRIQQLCNEYHQAAFEGYGAALHRLKLLLLRELELFEFEEARRNADRARWICPVTRSAAHDAFGNYEHALIHDLQSLRYARSDIDRAKSLVNISIGHRRVGEPDEALTYAKLACELRPNADWVIGYYALAIHAAGCRTEGLRLLENLLRVSNLTHPCNLVRVLLRFDRDFLPMLRELGIHDLRTIGNGQFGVAAAPSLLLRREQAATAW